MKEITLILAFLQIVFGLIVLCRLGFRIQEHRDLIQRFHRLPSQATYSSLAFDGILGTFIILSGAVWANFL